MTPGLKHFRHTVGLEGQSVINVNVDARQQTANIYTKGTNSFEQAMERQRARGRGDREGEPG